MKKRIAVVGIAQTRFERSIVDRNYADLVYEVTMAALEDAGMTIDQIDNVVTVSKVSVKNHGNAFKNPFAQLPMKLNVEDVMDSKPLAKPLKLYDCSPVSDGAGAVILAGENQAAKGRQLPVWIKGIGYSAVWHHLNDRQLSDPIALKQAAKRAYEEAGIKYPRPEIDCFEVYDAFSYREPLWLEGLGLCD